MSDALKVLVVDDEIIMCKLLKRSGTMIGVNVDFATNLFMVNKKEKYDLVLIDYLMRPNGKVVYNELKDVFPGADFAYYTSFHGIKDPEIPIIDKTYNTTMDLILSTRRIQCAFLTG